MYPCQWLGMHADSTCTDQHTWHDRCLGVEGHISCHVVGISLRGRRAGARSTSGTRDENNEHKSLNPLMWTAGDD